MTASRKTFRVRWGELATCVGVCTAFGLLGAAFVNAAVEHESVRVDVPTITAPAIPTPTLTTPPAATPVGAPIPAPVVTEDSPVRTDDAEPDTEPAMVDTSAPEPVTEAPAAPTPVWATLPPCAQEDSDNCYWNAATMGNGQGRSFYVIDGVVTYLEGE